MVGLHYFTCAGNGLRLRHVVSSASLSRLVLAVLCHHFGVPSSSLRHLRTGLGMEPCPTSSSDRVINAERINQLSRFHAQSFKFLTSFGSTKHYTFF